MGLINKVRETIFRHSLLSKNDRVLVGVSGGPDSVALILALYSLRKEFKLNLSIAHLDHQLRKESKQDQEFVSALAKKLGLPFSFARVDIKRLAKKGSIEEIARQERLRFLFNIAKQAGADKIALGHNQDDQAETVLMRLIRGSGLYGLAAILPKRLIGKATLIRPLIEVTRSEIEAYLKKRRASFCRDATNRDTIYFRNRLRKQLIPELARTYNPRIKEALANLAETAGSDYAYLQGVAARALERVKTSQRIGSMRGGGAPISLDLNKFSRLHPAIARLTLRLAIQQLKGSMRRITFKHIKEIEDLIAQRPAGSLVNLPQGVCVRKAKAQLRIFSA